MPRPAPFRRACTLNELLFFVASIALGAAAALYAARRWGDPWLSIAAFFAGLITIPVVVGALAFIDSRRRPALPVCERGRCRGWQYRCERVFESRHVDAAKLGRAVSYRCRCGDEYVLLGNRLLAARPDGVWRPFRKRDSLASREWREDDDRTPLRADVQNVVWECPRRTDGRRSL